MEQGFRKQRGATRLGHQAQQLQTPNNTSTCCSSLLACFLSFFLACFLLCLCCVCLSSSLRLLASYIDSVKTACWLAADITFVDRFAWTVLFCSAFRVSSSASRKAATAQKMGGGGGGHQQKKQQTSCIV